jgi:hypothetical protein
MIAGAAFFLKPEPLARHRSNQLDWDDPEGHSTRQKHIALATPV